MNIFCDSEESVVLKEAKQYLNKKFAELKDRPLLFLSSGGSSLKLLDGVEKQNISSNITIGVLDERFSENEKVSNFAQLTETNFFKKAQTKGASFINSRIQKGEILQDLAVRFEKGLRTWKEKNPEGKIVITLGIGVDWHTAGIMPFPENKELFYS